MDRFLDISVSAVCPLGDARILDHERDAAAARDYTNVIEPDWDDIDDEALDALAAAECSGLHLHFSVED